MPKKMTRKTMGSKRPMGRRRYSEPRGLWRGPRGCRLCRDKVKEIDYKNADLLRKFITERGKIVPSRISGNCASHQKRLSRAIRRARIMALVPFVGE